MDPTTGRVYFGGTMAQSFSRAYVRLDYDEMMRAVVHYMKAEIQKGDTATITVKFNKKSEHWSANIKITNPVDIELREDGSVSS